MSGPPETSPGSVPGRPGAPAEPRLQPDDGAAGGQVYGTPGAAAGPYPGTPGAAAGPYPAPPGGFGTPAPFRLLEPRPRIWPPERPEWITALAVVGALAVIGAALAPLWVHLAPRLTFRVDRPGRALPVVPEAEEYIAADGRFVFITLTVGVLAGLACWFVRRSRGPVVLLALAFGGLLGAVITWRLGLRIGTGYQPADLQHVGEIIYQPLTLRARSALMVEPIAAVVVYLLGVGFTARNDLGQGRASSGSG